MTLRPPAILLSDLWFFGLKQARACIFGGYLLALILLTKLWYPIEGLPRYDFLFLAALLFQAVLLVFKLETVREALVIFIFHLVATGMELFKTSASIQSWHYPERFHIGLYGVPFFAGFMYSAVGSYIARVWRLFDFRFSHYPPRGLTVVLALGIYINFFTHHYVPDLRWLLIAASVALFWRSFVHFRIRRTHRRMPLLLGWLLVALFIWVAENTATFAHIWHYPAQARGWQLVPLSKLIAWYLLMLVSFVLVSLVNQPVIVRDDPEA